MQGCSNSIANALELLQSCTKPPIWCVFYTLKAWPMFQLLHSCVTCYMRYLVILGHESWMSICVPAYKCPVIMVKLCDHDGTYGVNPAVLLDNKCDTLHITETHSIYKTQPYCFYEPINISASSPSPSPPSTTVTSKLVFKISCYIFLIFLCS